MEKPRKATTSSADLGPGSGVSAQGGPGGPASSVDVWLVLAFVGTRFCGWQSQSRHGGSGGGGGGAGSSSKSDGSNGSAGGSGGRGGRGGTGAIGGTGGAGGAGGGAFEIVVQGMLTAPGSDSFTAQGANGAASPTPANSSNSNNPGTNFNALTDPNGWNSEQNSARTDGGAATSPAGYYETGGAGGNGGSGGQGGVGGNGGVGGTGGGGAGGTVKLVASNINLTGSSDSVNVSGGSGGNAGAGGRLILGSNVYVSLAGNTNVTGVTTGGTLAAAGVGSDVQTTGPTAANPYLTGVTAGTPTIVGLKSGAAVAGVAAVSTQANLYPNALIQQSGATAIGKAWFTNADSNAVAALVRVQAPTSANTPTVVTYNGVTVTNPYVGYDMMVLLNLTPYALAAPTLQVIGAAGTASAVALQDLSGTLANHGLAALNGYDVWVTLIPSATNATFGVGFGAAGTFNALSQGGTLSKTTTNSGGVSGAFSADFVTLVATANPASQPIAGLTSLALSADGTMLFGVNPTLGAVVAVNAATGAQTQYFANGIGGAYGLAGASALAVSADGSDLYVISRTDQSLATFAIAPTSDLLTFQSSTKLGTTPTAITAAPGGERTMLIPAGTKLTANNSSETFTIGANMTLDAGSSSNVVYVSSALGVSAFNAAGQIGLFNGAVYGQTGTVILNGQTQTYATDTTDFNAAGTLTAPNGNALSFTVIPASAWTGPTDINSLTSFRNSNGNIFVIGASTASNTVYKLFDSAAGVILPNTFDSTTYPLSASKFSVAGGPGALALSPDDREIYVADTTGQAITVLSTGLGGTGLAFGSQVQIAQSLGLANPTGLAVTPGGQYVLASASGANAVFVYQRDAVTGALTLVQTDRNSTGGGLQNPSAIVISGAAAGSTATAYVASLGNSAVPGGYQPITVTLPSYLSGSVPLASRLASLYAPTLASLPLVADGPSGSSSKVIYGINPSTGALWVIDRTSLAELQGFADKVNASGLTGATGLALSPDGKYLYVTGTNLPKVVDGVPVGGSVSPSVSVFVVDPTTGLIKVAANGVAYGAVVQAPGLIHVTAGAAGGSAVANVVYGVNPNNGALVAFNAATLAVQQAFTDLTNAQDLSAAAATLAISSDGGTLTVTGGITAAVSTFAINPATGLLTETDKTAGFAATTTAQLLNDDNSLVTTTAGVFAAGPSGLSLLSSAAVATSGTTTTLAIPAPVASIAATSTMPAVDLTTLTGLAAKADGSVLYGISATTRMAYAISYNSTTGAYALLSQTSLAGTPVALALGVNTTANSSTLYVATATSVTVLNGAPTTASPWAATTAPSFTPSNAIGLVEVTNIAVSNDGTMVQLATDNNTVLYGFTRNTATGALSNPTFELNSASQDVKAITTFSSTIAAVTASLTGGGSDSLTLLAVPTTTTGNLTLAMGTGNDTVTVKSVGATGTLTVQPGASGAKGSNTVLVTAGTKGGTVVIDTATGGTASTTNTIFLNTVPVGETVTIKASSTAGASGTDVIQLGSAAVSPSLTTPTAGSIVMTGDLSKTTVNIDPGLPANVSTVNATGTPAASQIYPPVVAVKTGAITEGVSNSVTLTATVNYGTNTPYGGLSFDLNGDGVFGDALATQGSTNSDGSVNETLVLTWQQLEAFGISKAGSYTIAAEAFSLPQGVTQATAANLLTGAGTAQITVSYAAPVVAVTIPSTETTVASVGSAYTVNLSAVTQGTEAATGWTVAWGDTTTSTYDPGTTSASHVYTNPGSYTVTGTFTDSVGSTAASQKITANVLASSLTLIAPASIAEGQSLTLSVAGPGTPSNINWVFPSAGSGVSTSTASTTLSWAQLVNLIAGYGVSANSMVGPYAIQAQVGYAGQKSIISASGSFTIVDTPPTASAAAVTVAQGAPIRLVVTEDSVASTDASVGFVNAFDLTNSGTIAYTAGANVIGVSASGGPTTITLPSTIVLDAGTYIGTGYATDQNGGRTAFATSITVNPVAEAVTATLPATATIGVATALTLDAKHVLPEAVTGWIVNWGDGAVQTVTGNAPTVTAATATTAGTNDVSQTLNHIYINAGTFSVGVTAIDQSGTLALAAKSVVVGALTPTLTLAAPAAISEGNVATLTGTIGNTAAGDTYVANVVWGDNGSVVTTTTLAAGASGFALTHLYANSPTGLATGTFPISVFISDQTAGTKSVTSGTSIEVDNVAPTISFLAANPTAITLGGTVTLTGVVGEPAGSADTNTVSVNWGDGTAATQATVGSVNALGNASFSATHVYNAVPTTGTITAVATNEDKLTATATTPVSVTRTAPSLSFGVPVGTGGTLLATGVLAAGATGGAVTVTGTVTDAAVASAANLTTAITWGDGSTASTPSVTAGGGGTWIFTASHTYTALFSAQSGGQFNIAATVTDQFGLSATGTAIVAPAIPALSVVQGSTISEGGTATLTGVLTEIGTLNTSTGTLTAATHSVVVTWGDGTSSPAGAVTVTDSKSGTGSFVASHVYQSPSGTGGNTITVTSTDSNNVKATATTTETVLDVAATLSGLVLNTPTITEGSSVTLTGTITEPGTLDSNTVSVNWGDGSTAAAATVTQALGHGTFTATYTYLNSPPGSQTGAFTIVATATNTAKQIGVATTTATVSTVAPTLSGVAVDHASVTAGSLVTLTGTIAEPGTLDTNTVSVDWGDGTAAGTATVVQSKGNGTFTATHTYQSAATSAGYAITATATNEYGQTGTATAKESVSATTGTFAVSGTIYDWSTHVELSGVTVYLTNTASGLVTTASTDGYGTYVAGNLAAGSYSVTAALPSFTLGNTITAADALAALKLSVALDPNSVSSSGQLSTSPYQYIAADVLAGGVDTSADALAILKISVGLTGSVAANWVFVPESTSFYNATTKSLTISQSNVPTSFAGALSVTGNTTYNLVGVLRGDVLGAYTPYTSSGTLVVSPPTLPVSYFNALSASTGVPLYVWGLAASTTAANAALVQAPASVVLAAPVVAVTTLAPAVTVATTATPFVDAVLSVPVLAPSLPVVPTPVAVEASPAAASPPAAAPVPVSKVAAVTPGNSFVAHEAASPQARADQPLAVTPASAVRLQAVAPQLPALVPPSGMLPRPRDEPGEMAMMFDEETGELMAWSGDQAGWDLPQLVVDDFGEAWQVLPMQALPLQALGVKAPGLPANRLPV